MKKSFFFSFLLLILAHPVRLLAKDRVLTITITVVDADKGQDGEITDAAIEVMRSGKGKAFKPVLVKKDNTTIIKLPLGNFEYDISVRHPGYRTVVYNFTASQFDYSEVNSEADYEKGKLFVRMKKTPPGTKDGDQSPEVIAVMFNPRTQSMVLKKEKKAPKVDYVARFMMTKKNKTEPEGVAHGRVMLKDTAGTILDSTKTDTKGICVFKQLSPDKKYNVELQKSKDIPDNAQVYLTKENGTIVQKLNISKSGKSFNYEVLPTELSKLTPIADDDDAQLKVQSFSKSSEKEINIVQYIYYDVGQWEISAVASLKFDQIAQIMKDNPNLKLEVGSHTDSNGDDLSNMKLSEKRAQTAVDYLVAKGVPANRVVGKGYGETHLLNRCKNGVDCYEEEHAQNRRTEFRFLKP